VKTHRTSPAIENEWTIERNWNVAIGGMSLGRADFDGLGRGVSPSTVTAAGRIEYGG